MHCYCCSSFTNTHFIDCAATAAAAAASRQPSDRLPAPTTCPVPSPLPAKQIVGATSWDAVRCVKLNDRPVTPEQQAAFEEWLSQLQQQGGGRQR